MVCLMYIHMNVAEERMSERMRHTGLPTNLGILIAGGYRRYGPRTPDIGLDCPAVVPFNFTRIEFDDFVDLVAENSARLCKHAT